MTTKNTNTDQVPEQKGAFLNGWGYLDMPTDFVK
jgi:hypothetical protein